MTKPQQHRNPTRRRPTRAPAKRDARRIPKHFRIAMKSNPGMAVTNFPLVRDRKTGEMVQDERLLVASIHD